MSKTIAAMRASITELATKGTESVDAVRKAFTAGVAPLQTVNSGSAADFIAKFGNNTTANEIVKSTARLGLSTSPVGTTKTAPRPEIDFVEVDNDPTYGSLDGFYTRIVVTIPRSDVASVSSIRLLRSSATKIAGVVEPAFSALIDGGVVRHSRNNTDPIGISAIRAAQIGVGNKLTRFVFDDPFSPQRGVVSSGTLRVLPIAPNTNRLAGSTNLLSIAGADRSVLENATFYTNRRIVDPQKPATLPLSVSTRQGINILRGSAVGTSTIVEVGNSAGFHEIARIAISLATMKIVGDYVELQMFDPSVVYGNSYTYYAVCHRDGRDGPRSRLVNAKIMHVRPPLTPEVLYSVVAGRPRFSIRCHGKFIDHVEIFRRGGTPRANVRMLGSNKAMISDSTAVGTESGFFHIGDYGATCDKSVTFVDSNVLPGYEYDYRLYSVDSFGNKSQTPFLCKVRLPDLGQSIPLRIPSILAEQGSGGREVRITVMSDDERISTVVVARREISNGESAFHQPTEPSYVTLGNTTAKRSRSRSGPQLRSTANAWVGTLGLTAGSAKMTDGVVGLDRTYQYSVYGIDIRGNKSSYAQSGLVKLSLKPVLSTPTGFTAKPVFDVSSAPLGVMMTWDAPTDDFSPNELIGDQDVLAASMQRTVFQVERKAVGSSIWDALPAVTGTTFLDVLGSRQVTEYDYRMMAMQSGGFVTTTTDVIRVSVAPELLAPETVWVRATDTSLRPIHVVVSWNYTGKWVDGWEIERAAVNKIFAAKITSMDSAAAMALEYTGVAKINCESSRATGISSDKKSKLDGSVFVGNRFFIDQNASMENSYFYRIRAVSLSKLSPWSYAGIMLSDSPHDRKFMSTLSDTEKVDLSLDSRAVSFWRKK